jgi:hypothetical protein
MVYTNDRGKFTAKINANGKIVAIITCAGFESREIIIDRTNDEISISLKPSGQLNEVIVTGVNKVQSRLMEAPVSIEYVGLRNITNSPAPSYYNTLNVKKGVDVTTSSLTFNTISTRGFNGSGSSR